MGTLISEVRFNEQISKVSNAKSAIYVALPRLRAVAQRRAPLVLLSKLHATTSALAEYSHAEPIPRVCARLAVVGYKKYGFHSADKP